MLLKTAAHRASATLPGKMMRLERATSNHWPRGGRFWLSSEAVETVTDEFFNIIYRA
jgi:hypothetical protein